MTDNKMAQADAPEQDKTERGPMAKAIEPVHDDVIRKSRLIYANGLFASSDDSTTREEECVRISEWLVSYGYSVGAADVLRWRETGAPDGILWDDVREGSDGIIRGETYPFGKNGEEEVLRRSVAVAENLLAVSSAALRYTELYDAQGEHVEWLYTAQHTKVPVGGLRPTNMRDVISGLKTADGMLQTASKRLTDLQEGITDRDKMVSEIATEIMLSINPTYEQLESFKLMVTTGKITVNRRPLEAAHGEISAAAENLEPIDATEDGNTENDFEERMAQARAEADERHEEAEEDAPYMQPPEEEEESDLSEEEDDWEAESTDGE